MLAEESDILAHTAGSHIGSTAKENSTPGILAHFFGTKVCRSIRGDFLIGKAPFYHLVYAVNSLTELSGLEAKGLQVSKHLIIVYSLVQVVTLHSLSVKSLRRREAIKVLVLLII